MTHLIHQVTGINLPRSPAHLAPGRPAHKPYQITRNDRCRRKRNQTNAAGRPRIPRNGRPFPGTELEQPGESPLLDGVPLDLGVPHTALLLLHETRSHLKSVLSSPNESRQTHFGMLTTSSAFCVCNFRETTGEFATKVSNWLVIGGEDNRGFAELR